MVSLNDVLLAMSNIPVDDPIAEMWGRGLQGGYEIIEYTGALPITITADGNALLDYRIYGNTVQNGTPTPENPVDVVGCGERTENLLPFDDKNFVISSSGSNLIVECKNGSLNMKGTATEIITTNENWEKFFSFELKAGTYYCNSPSPLGSAFGRYIKKYNDNSNILLPNEYTFTITENTKCYLSFYIYNKVIDSEIKLMLNLGSTALPYEPYGYKLPILSNSTVTNIYLGEVETTRRIKKLVLDGTENWTGNDTSPTKQLTLNGYLQLKTITCVCTHYNAAINVRAGEIIPYNSCCFYLSPPYNVLFLKGDESSEYPKTINDFKSYLAAQYANGTPVTIWYVLVEPETAVVNEPLMKIGDYSDTVSMEQAGVSIPTFAGTTGIDYDGAPKPSEMYIKYRR